MQKIILILLSILLFSSCKHDKNPIEFKKMDNLDLGNISKETANLKATAIFFNNSKQSYLLKDVTLDFSIDGKDIGTIVVKNELIIQPNATFSIPIKYNYETNSFINPGHDPSLNYAVEFKGEIIYTNEKGKEANTADMHYATSYEYLTKKEIRIEKRETRKEERKKRREERKEKRQNK